MGDGMRLSFLGSKLRIPVIGTHQHKETVTSWCTEANHPKLACIVEGGSFVQVAYEVIIRRRC